MSEPGNFQAPDASAVEAQLAARAQALLAERLRRRAAGEAPAAASIPRLARRDDRVPLSFAQERLWFLERLEPGGAANVVPLAIALRGPLDVAVWRGALAEVVRRHEALRTLVTEGAEGPVGVVAPAGPVPMPLHDLTRLPVEEREAEARRLALAEARQPFDLEHGPLLRAALVRLGAESHWALVTLHHVAADGWSLRVLIAELTQLYDAFVIGGLAPLPELPIQYADYAAWQRQRLAGEALVRELEFWRERLAGAPVLDLPTDQPRPVVQSLRGDSVLVALAPELSPALRRLGREAGASMFMTFLAAFQALLGRYAGQEVVSVGTPVAGRDRVETEGLIGLFLNTLVLRTDLSGEPTFAELLARAREVVLAAHAHQELPFERLVEDLQPERSMAHAPLFQVMFVLQPPVEEAPALSGLAATVMQAERGAAQFDLTLSLSDTAAGVRGRLEYAVDLFERGTMERLVGHLETLLAAAAAEPGQRVSELPLLTPAERRQLFLDWNATEASYPQATLPKLLAASAAARPEAVAAEYAGECLTYAELEARANRLARYLAGRGVGPEVRVGLCLERSLDLLVAVLGVMKAGGVYVPLDPAYPRERIALVLEDAAAPVLVTQESLRELLPAEGATIVSVDAERDAIARESAAPFPCPAALDNLVYVLFTSGSTGRPKGVQVTHGALVNFLEAVRRQPGLAAGEALLAITTLSFDIAAFELYLPPLVGGRLVIASRETAADGRLLAEELIRSGTTLLQATPATWRMLLEVGWEGDKKLLALCGGEALPEDLAVQLLPRIGSLWNFYGPTETTIWSSVLELREGEPMRVGPPLANTRFYVVDRSSQPAPVGVPGELLIGGDGLARGYLGRPDLTAERFVPDPFGGAGERLYRTGDLVRWRSDGRLEFLGRLDHQVKVRGFRIELGEVEATLAHQPGVERVVVVARGDAAEKRLVAYVVGEAEPARLREALRRQLPDYMVPSVFVKLDALPLTPNGKVDRKALPEPDAAAEPAAEHVAPRTPAEELLVEIWREVLRRERLGVQDDFFALGGHSLLATRVVARVRQAFGIELPLRRVFERPTVAGLALEIEAAVGAEAPAAPPLLPAPRDRELPLSFAQERLWFLDAMEPGTATLNLPATLRLRGRLEAHRLEAALAAVVARHEVLRTRFPAAEGRPRQEVVTAFNPLLERVDLAALPPGTAREREAAARIAAERDRPFDLAGGPLLRAALLRLDTEEHLLLLTVHHIVADGWSMSILLHELTAQYAALSEGHEAELPPLPVQYADYAVWQRQWLEGEELAGQVGYWRERLAGAPPLLDLPLDRPRPPVQTFRGAMHTQLLGAELTAGLYALGRREGATLFMTLLAGLSTLLGRLAGQEDVCVGAPVAGRGRAEIEGLIGCFLNTLVLRTRLAGEPSFRDLLGQVRETTLSAFAHQELPFEKLLEELQPERTLAHTPLFQVFLNVLNFPRTEARLPELSLEVVRGHDAPAKFDLTLYVAEPDGDLRLHWVYNADLFDPSRVEEMARQLALLLAAAVEEPVRSIAALPLLTAGAVRFLPDPAAPLDAGWHGAVHERFAEIAATFPDLPAVSDPTESWSYGKLACYAHRLAHRLAREGVGKGDVVALWGHRSAPLVAGLLATLESGAAFVVLDPAYPAARLVETLRLARPAGFLEVEAAGPPPEAVDEALAAVGCRCRLVLPPKARLVERDPAAGEPETPLGIPVGPDDLAYIAFTSGSTGSPKGILGRHGSLSHFIPWQRYRYGFGEGDRFSLLSGLSHDPLHRDVFTPLQTGGSIAVPDPERIGSPGYLAGWLRDEGVTVANLTPAMGQLLAEGGGVGSLPALRLAFVVGDILTRRDVLRLQELAPELVCVNHYGSTETQRAVGYYVVPPADVAGVPEVLPLGRGIPDVQLLVVNEAGQLAGIGEVGEIWVRSPHVALGYLGEPERTAERFGVNPWTSDAADRAYRTGDLGRYLPGGDVTFAGRVDQQVKVRGFRIELGEIESVLGRHSGVREAAVVARGEGSDKRLVAYVVPSDGDADVAALRAFLKERLPDYMVPSAWVVLAALPVTPNGKLDRRALPEPPEECSAGEPVAPRTLAEELVVEIWREVLRRERIGVHDDFFDLGGHSLLATQVVARVRNALGVELPLRAVFEAPTPAGLAERIGRGVATRAAPPLRPMLHGRELPLSFAQERLWFLERLELGAAYHMPMALSLRGRLDVAAWRQGLAEIVRRHQALRTGITEGPAGPIGLPVPDAHFVVPLFDLTALPVGRREAEARRLAFVEARRPFDLERGRLLHAALVRLDADAHYALLTVHHIVADGWSVRLLLAELSALYAAFSAGRPSPLPELPIQYADYAAWQRQWLRGETLDALLAAWRARLAGTTVLDLPTDRPRPPVQSFRGDSLTVAIPLEQARGLRRLGREAGGTLFMTLLAAFQALLARYSGQEAICVGTPIAGRTQLETEKLIGLFVNALALRTDLAGDPSFAEALARVREVTLDAHTHQDLPFEKLVEELQPERSLAHAPLFQVFFVLQNAADDEPALPDLTVTALRAERRAAQYDLKLSLTEHGEGVRGYLEYATDLFERPTIERLWGHLRTLLEGAVEEPRRRLSELPWLTAEERRQLAAWNDTARDHGPATTLHALIEEQVERTPEAVAVVFEGEGVTYRELDRRAGVLARRLRRLGGGPERLVAVAAERSLELVVALLGVLKAGAAYVPIDPSYPAGLLSYMLEDSQTGVERPVVLTQERLLERLPLGPLRARGGEVVLLDAGWQDTDEGEGDLPVAVDPNHPAYMIYTSGSTGRPKGAVNTHRAIVNRLLWMQEAFGLGPEDRVLQKTPFSFDVSVWEFFWPLLVGARLVVARPGGHQDACYLARLIQEEDITTLHFVPSMLQVFLEEPEASGCHGLRRVVCSGEALAPELVRRFFERLPEGPELHNLYGPTEAAVDVSWWECTPEDAGRGVPIGRPIANLTLTVVDRDLQPVAVGVPGELLIGGVGLARGYHNRSDLTAEKFVPGPFAAEPGARLYRTGDLTRLRPDGAIEYLGRLDHQVKLRGFRIELGEIEAALRAHPAVRDVVVVARGEGESKQLVAYLVADCVGAELASALREHLRSRLPEHMIPGAFVALPALPLSPNGKVDRKALPDPEAGTQATAQMAPRTLAEELVVGIWREVLGREGVGVHDNFFDLGGHSLLATQIVARIRNGLGLDLPVRAVFETPTPAGLAERLERGSTEPASVPPLVPVPRDGALPLSFAQERLWFLERLEPGGAAYNLGVALALHGPLDVAAWRRAVGEVARRHEALRTRFREGAEGPVAELMPAAAVTVEFVDLTGLSQAARAAEGRRRALLQARRPFDLAAGPPVRASLLRLEQEEHWALLTVHHVAADGWSVRLLLGELSALYGAFAAGDSSPLPELPIQYADYAAWQREWLRGEALERQLTFWRERLAGPTVLDLPTDRPRPPVQSFRGDTLPVALPTELALGLRRVGREAGGTLFMTLLAAFQALLARYSGQEAVSVGTPIAGRTRVEIEKLIGLFVNTLVLRTDFAGDPTFATALGRVREAALEAHAHQDLPFEKLVEELQPERSLAHASLFQVMFGMQNAAGDETAFSGLAVTPLHAERAAAQFDLTLSLFDTGGSVRGRLEYATDLFERGTIERLWGHLSTLLQGVVEEPRRPLSELPWLTAEERRQLVAWNDTARDYGSSVALHVLIKEQVERSPEAVAVVFEGEGVTYRELDRRAGALARRLRRLGVGPESLVAVAAERSLELVVALLGVLKAGAAYVPIDPSYPAERLSYMLEDSQAGTARPVVLTQERLLERLPLGPLRAGGGEVVLLDGGWDESTEASDGDPPVSIDPDHPAYMIYTSGSTGRPKGAVNSHRAIVNRLLWGQETFGLGPDDRVLQKTPFSFDVSVWEFFWPLLVGARLVVARPGGHQDARYLARLIQEEGITTLHFVPSMLQVFLEEPETAGCRNLRRVMCSGEALAPELVRRFFERLPEGPELHNLYGPTEAAVEVSWWACSPEDVGRGVPIGRPIANLTLTVVDRDLRPVAVGVPGELLIGGVGLARGYHNRPDLTAERFVPDPFAAEPGARLYRTGDLTRLRADGAIEYLGRLDHQVKLRGFRIELGEIEAALRAHPTVHDVVVVARGEGESRHLIAYIVGTDGEPPADALREHLGSRLPEHMIPAAFVALPALPLSPNGKVDRKALPAPEAAAGPGAVPVAPRTLAEELVAEIWREVLGRESVGVNDNFFEIGGHSLLAMRVVSRIAHRVGLDVPLRTAFEAPTLEGFAGALERALLEEVGEPAESAS